MLPAAGIARLPAPAVTEVRAVELTAHGPPVGADPQPAPTDRAKSSAAIVVAPLTVTSCVTVPVAPSGSVTVSVTWKVPLPA